MGIIYARRAISDFAVCFLRLNPPACHGRSREKDNAPSPLSVPSVHTPRAYYTAASPALPAVPGVEDALNVTMAQRSELDYLIYNEPLGHADLILNGDPEEYLKNMAGSHGSEI